MLNLALFIFKSAIVFLSSMESNVKWLFHPSPNVLYSKKGGVSVSLVKSNDVQDLEAVNEEVVYQNPLLYLKIWEIYNRTRDPRTLEEHCWHYHKEVELLAIIDGYLGMQSKDHYTVLGPGDVRIFGASQLHRTHQLYTDKLRYIVFQIDLQKHFDQSTMPYLYCFSELTQPLDVMNYIFEENESVKDEFHTLITEIFTESQSKLNGYEIAISSMIKQIMLLLLRHDTRNLLSYTEKAALHRLQPVLSYIDHNLENKITVEEACSLLNLSYHYFIKYFKKTMGKSFIDYVNYKRIKKAERLLMTSDLSIENIGYDVGIPNMAQFYKLFRRYNNCSPKEFKERMRNEG